MLVVWGPHFEKHWSSVSQVLCERATGLRYGLWPWRAYLWFEICLLY